MTTMPASDVPATNRLRVIRMPGAPFGALVQGWEPERPVDDALRAEVRAALAEHVVLVFRGHRQPTDDELIDFASAFGPLIKGSEWLRDAGDRPEILPVTNVKDETGVPKGTGGAGQLEWHADYSYVDRPARESFLNAVELPEAQPRTCFANQYTALETLPPELVERLRTLTAHHSVAEYVEGGQQPDQQQLYVGFEAKKRRDEEAGIVRPAIPEATHPVVMRHPDTGREMLYVSKGLTRQIDGMAREESNALLKQLHLHSTAPEKVYAHDWQVGDLVVFDALAGLHRRDSWDRTQRRVMRQLSTSC